MVPLGLEPPSNAGTVSAESSKSTASAAETPVVDGEEARPVYQFLVVQALIGVSTQALLAELVNVS